MKEGKIFIISGPSGVGKTTIRNRILSDLSDIKFSVSYTTRGRRKGEKEGIDYFYISEDDFKKKIEEGFFAEWAKVYNHYYGTSKKFIEECIKSGKHCLLDIDVQGSMQIKKHFPEAISFFIMPPNREELIRRLKRRNSESKEDFEIRVKNAEKEISYKDKYNYVIINDDVDRAVKEIKEIMKKYY